MVRTEFSDGTEFFYQGPQGAERKVRVEEEGDKTFYEGEHNIT